MEVFFGNFNKLFSHIKEHRTEVYSLAFEYNHLEFRIFAFNPIFFITHSSDNISYRVFSKEYKIEPNYSITKLKPCSIPYYNYTKDDEFQLSTLVPSEFIQGIITINAAYNEVLKMKKEYDNKCLD